MVRDPIIEKCNGCDRTIVGPEPGPASCSVFAVPSSKWRTGNCNMATHIKKEVVETKGFINPLKASKRKAAGR
jgi:hypothetical protein